MTKVETVAQSSTVGTRSPATRRWANVVALVCAFIAGAGVGTGVTMQTMRGEALRMFRSPEHARREFLQRLRADLKLDDEQFTKIEAIVNRHHDQFDVMRHEIHPRIEALFAEMDREVAAELTPEQKPAFGKFIEERHRMFPPPPPLKAPPEPAPHSKT